MGFVITRRHLRVLAKTGLIVMFIRLLLTVELEAGYQTKGMPDGVKDMTHDKVSGRLVRVSSITPLVYANLKSMNLSELKEYISLYNKMQPVQNADKFVFDKDSTGIVFLIHVHNRFEALQLLVRTLEKVKDIHTCLLIFSHDVANDTFNQYISNITFAPVLQIFFPFSTQLYPDKFPGAHPNDCAPDENVTSAQARGCNSAMYPDSHGRYRDSRVTQAKHHWVWTLRFAFQNVRLLRNFPGLVVQLNDNWYVAEDAVHVLRKSAVLMSTQCLGCMMVLGMANQSSSDLQTSTDVLLKKTWNTGILMGLSFTSFLWQQLQVCAATFCGIDDHSWDWSFLFTTQMCFQNHFLSILQPVVPRVRQTPCNKDEACALDMQRIGSTFRIGKWFPERLNIVEAPLDVSVETHTRSGGWRDPRDVALCEKLLSNYCDVDLVE